MKFQKDKDESWSVITKNYRTWFGFYHYWWDWALPLHINIETWHEGYIDIYLHVLFFTFNYTKIPHKFLKEIDTMFKDNEND